MDLNDENGKIHGQRDEKVQRYERLPSSEEEEELQVNTRKMGAYIQARRPQRGILQEQVCRTRLPTNSRSRLRQKLCPESGD